jgi:hypothetical protein
MMLMALVGLINDEEDEESNHINEAASRTNDTFDILQTENCDPPIILPSHTVAAESFYTLCSNTRLFTVYWRIV